MHLKDFIYIAIYLVILAAAARVSIDIPYTDIDITGQTLALLTMACVFPMRISVIGILLYLLIGIAGVPVFSDGTKGWDHFIGSSLGYFIGFVLATIILASAVTYKWIKHSIFNFIILHLVGTLIILSCGVLNLSLNLGIYKAITAGMIPFITAGVVKSILGGWGSYLMIYYRKFS